MVGDDWSGSLSPVSGAMQFLLAVPSAHKLPLPNWLKNNKFPLPTPPYPGFRPRGREMGQG